MRRPGDSSRPLRCELSNTLAVGWSSTNGTWPLALEMQEDIPAHVEARIADVCDFFRRQFNEGARRVARTVECLQRPCARRRIAS